MKKRSFRKKSYNNDYICEKVLKEYMDKHDAFLDFCKQVGSYGDMIYGNIKEFKWCKLPMWADVEKYEAHLIGDVEDTSMAEEMVESGFGYPREEFSKFVYILKLSLDDDEFEKNCLEEQEPDSDFWYEVAEKLLNTEYSYAKNGNLFWNCLSTDYGFQEYLANDEYEFFSSEPEAFFELELWKYIDKNEEEMRKIQAKDFDEFLELSAEAYDEFVKAQVIDTYPDVYGSVVPEFFVGTCVKDSIDWNNFLWDKFKDYVNKLSEGDIIEVEDKKYAISRRLPFLDSDSMDEFAFEVKLV